MAFLIAQYDVHKKQRISSLTDDYLTNLITLTSLQSFVAFFHPCTTKEESLNNVLVQLQ